MIYKIMVVHYANHLISRRYLWPIWQMLMTSAFAGLRRHLPVYCQVPRIARMFPVKEVYAICAWRSKFVHGLKMLES